MKSAADFRLDAREALRGNWAVAVIAGLIAFLLGGVSVDGSGIRWNWNITEGNFSVSVAGQPVFSSGNGFQNAFGRILAAGAVYITIAVILLAILYFIFGSVIETGYAGFNLKLLSEEDAAVGSLFSYFYNWKTTAATRFLKGLYILLWSLLLVVPGIIASYSYAMTGYILAEHPELTASEAIERSKQMMSGNRFRLFCLQLSFIGWVILCAFTFGIGNLWLRPYQQAATAAFYKEIS